MISLARLLLDRTDGELTAEQEHQVGLIHRSATSLGEMVNDLLDLAKIEAGKVDLHVAAFAVADVLARGACSARSCRWTARCGSASTSRPRPVADAQRRAASSRRCCATSSPTH